MTFWKSTSKHSEYLITNTSVLPDRHELAVLVRAQDKLAPFQRVVHDGLEALERGRKAHWTTACLGA